MGPDRPASEEQPFFAASQWGCFLFLAVLALVAIASALRAFSGGPTTTHQGLLLAAALLPLPLLALFVYPWLASRRPAPEPAAIPPPTTEEEE